MAASLRPEFPDPLGPSGRPGRPGRPADLTPPDVRWLAWHEACSHALLGREVRDLGDAVLLHDETDREPFWNRLAGVDWPADPGAFDVRLTGALALFAGLDRVPHVWPMPGFDGPPDLAARLVANGFEDYGGGLLMALDPGRVMPEPDRVRTATVARRAAAAARGKTATGHARAAVAAPGRTVTAVPQVVDAHGRTVRALGRPVVSTVVAGIPELVSDGESGWLVPAGDVHALQAALAVCLAATPQQLDVMGRCGRARVLAGHDVDESASRVAALFAAA